MHQHRDSITLARRLLPAILQPSSFDQPRPWVMKLEYLNDQRFRRAPVPAHMFVSVSSGS